MSDGDQAFVDGTSMVGTEYKPRIVLMGLRRFCYYFNETTAAYYYYFMVFMMYIL
jgi:hypothetical protein